MMMERERLSEWMREKKKHNLGTMKRRKWKIENHVNQPQQTLCTNRDDKKKQHWLHQPHLIANYFFHSHSFFHQIARHDKISSRNLH